MPNEKSKKSNGHDLYAKAKFRLTDRQIDNIMFAFTVTGADTIKWVHGVSPKGIPRGKYTFQEISRGGSVLITERPTGNVLELNLDTLMWGFRRFLMNTTLVIGAFPLISDPNVADKIIQYTIFGEVKYE